MQQSRRRVEEEEGGRAQLSILEIEVDSTLASRGQGWGNVGEEAGKKSKDGEEKGVASPRASAAPGPRLGRAWAAACWAQ